MVTRIDFIKLLEVDMAVLILMLLDDPRDLIHAIAVSRFWKHFVIKNRLCKGFCVRCFPQLARVSKVTEETHGENYYASVGSNSFMDCETLEREHRAYAFLIQSHKVYEINECIRTAISASSTNNYLTQSVRNTLFQGENDRFLCPYWSSTGRIDHAVPERLTYKLMSDICVVTEIGVQLFGDYDQSGPPLYSAMSVCFRLGHPKFPNNLESDFSDLPLRLPVNDKFIWTYTSQEFAMAQDFRLQTFKLPEPVLCIGGFIQIELSGRVQKQETDALYCIRVSHVKVLGQNLHPAFDVELADNSEEFVLNYDPTARFIRLSPHQIHATSLRSKKRVLKELGFPDGHRVPFLLDQFLVEVNGDLQALLKGDPLYP